MYFWHVIIFLVDKAEFLTASLLCHTVFRNHSIYADMCSFLITIDVEPLCCLIFYVGTIKHFLKILWWIESSAFIWK